MLKSFRSLPLRVAGLLALGAIMAIAGALALRGTPAQAQSIMSAPACQCSAPTSVTGMSSRIAHCMCGAMSCAVTEIGEQGAKSSLMQCVRQ